MGKDKKLAVVKLRADIAVDEKLTLSQLAAKVGEVEKLLHEIGTGDVRIVMPRGTYSA